MMWWKRKKKTESDCMAPRLIDGSNIDRERLDLVGPTHLERMRAEKQRDEGKTGNE